jgi:hypothetical protein
MDFYRGLRIEIAPTDTSLETLVTGQENEARERNCGTS